MLLNRLAEANAAATLNSLRLTAGKKVLTPGDDPSTFVALSGLQNQLCTVTATMANVTAASSMITQAQSTVDQIETQLNTIRTELLKDEDRNLTSEQRAEAQANIDAAIAQINTLAETEIGGRRLLDGSADYRITGRDSNQVADLTVYSTPYGSSPIISGTVISTGSQATLTHTGSGGQITADATFTLAGDLGSVSVSVTNLEDLVDVAERINDDSHKTGVTASVNGDQLTLTSVDYGTNAEMSITVSLGTFDVTGGNGDGTANGTDASAQINGLTYSGTNVDGNRFNINQNGFRYSIEFVDGFTGNFDTIGVSGEALTFALSGNLSYRSTVAIGGLQPERLGGLSGTLDELASGGTWSGLDGNTSQAIRVVDEALGDLGRVEGSVDGFYNASITSASNLLADLQTDLQDTIDQTDGYNADEEALLLAKNQALAANARSSLAILYQQRSAIVYMIKVAAGLANSPVSS